jgi:hypothetical protein
MSDRNRYGYTAFGFVLGFSVAVLILVWAIPEFHYPPYRQSSQQTYSQVSQNERSEKDSEHYWIPALSGYVFTEDSLAQWLMAALGIAATVISALALVWLKKTWDQTKRTADAAFQAIDTARKANEIAQAVGEAQSRAYCLVMSATIEAGEPNSAGAGYRKLYAAIVIKNYGQTPATQAGGWVICNSFSRTDGKLGNTSRSKTSIRSPLASGAHEALTTNLTMRNEGQLPDEIFIIHGCWSYRDWSGVRRLTRFRFTTDFPRTVLTKAKRGNFAT